MCQMARELDRVRPRECSHSERSKKARGLVHRAFFDGPQLSELPCSSLNFSFAPGKSSTGAFFKTATGGHFWRLRAALLEVSHMASKLYVGNLPFSASEEDVRDLFSQYGEVISVKLISDRETGRPRGFGFVEMENANEAMGALDNYELEGRNLKVNEAQERRGGGGGGGGGGGRW